MSDNESPSGQRKGRYRKVEARTWGDEKFRALSPIPPCGQGLFLFLITGPFTGPIPGLFQAGRAAMAEALDWDQEAFDKAFREALAQGMVKADFKARVVWVPNAIKHNRPESPNVVRSWGAEFDLIPECDLKREAFEALKASVCALGEAFAKAFIEAFGKPSAKPSCKTIGNQEQEQEQEQKKETPHTPRGGKTSAVGLKSWLEAIKAKGEKPIPPGDAVFAYADEVGLPSEFLHLAWREFLHRYSQPDAKRYRDWRAVFRKAIRGNWLKLWYLDGQGAYALTTVGVQAQRSHGEKAA